MEDKLKGFLEHHVNIHGEKGNQAICDCVLCGKENHFYINTETLLWDCKVCGARGNYQQFLYRVSQMYAKALREHPDKLKELSVDRGLPSSAFLKYDIGWDDVGERYTIPVQHSESSCVDIRLYKLGMKTRCSNHGGMSGSGLFAADRIDMTPEGPVYVCEGEWDAMAISWLLAKNKQPGAVVGVPGANTFKREWIHWFAGRDVVLMYDHDNAGEQGERLAKERLTGSANSITYVRWPEDMPSGFDARDWVKYGIKVEKLEGSWRNLQKLMSSTSRNEEFSQATAGDSVESKKVVDKRPITNEELKRTYKKWMYLPDESVIDVMFGTVFANKLEGDPIWLFLVAPPGGSKSELLMSLSTSSQIVCMTSLTPHALVSGAVWSNGKDPSLLPQLNGKILVLKDFTTITSMNYAARDEIFGILRDVYDGRTEKYFGTGVKREYKSKFGVLAGVTPVIETFGTLHASLGERFLKYKLQGDTKETEEQKILKAISNINQEVGMRQELCVAAQRCLTRPMPKEIPRFSMEYVGKVVALAQMTAWLRGVVERDRFTQQVLYRPSSEVGTRLAKQFVKLAMGIGIFKGVKSLQDNEYEVIKKVAKHTCPDRVQTVIRAIWEAKCEGIIALKSKDISLRSRLPFSTVFRILEDLELLKVVKRHGASNAYLWSLSEPIYKLIDKSEIYMEPKKRLRVCVRK